MGAKLVIISIAVTLTVLAVAWFGDQTGATLNGLPLMAAMALGVFAVQWVGMIHARLFETEHWTSIASAGIRLCGSASAAARRRARRR